MVDKTQIDKSKNQLSNVRVRFCPSPTGTPHVGLIRTALFNWAYAKHVKGTLIFRIEDTDSSRDSEESYQLLIKALRWLGLDWDEGVEVGGPHGPYRQSERKNIYQDVAQKLLSAGYAYKSFSTEEDIKARNLAAGRSEHFGYDNYDRNLTTEQIADFEKQGKQAIIRFRMPDEDITFNDLVRGQVTFKQGQVPDYGIVRANGEALYTLTNPVDDAMMKVTHVLRGEDLLSSTPRQIALYRAMLELGIADVIPQFGHLPYVMGEGNKKLSKRDPRSNLFRYKEMGFLPEGFLNYLSLLGWSIAPDRDIFTLKEMCEKFDISDVTSAAARFDEKKAIAINATHLRNLSCDEFSERSLDYLDESIKQTPNFSGKFKAIAKHVQSRVQMLSEVQNLVDYLFVSADELQFNEDALTQLKGEFKSGFDQAIDYMTSLSQDDFGKISFDGDMLGDFDQAAEKLHQLFTDKLITQAGLKPRDAFSPMRVAITGKRVSPPLFESMVILGRDECLARFKKLRAIV